jgi:hypothetical protein
MDLGDGIVKSAGFISVAAVCIAGIIYNYDPHALGLVAVAGFLVVWWL